MTANSNKVGAHGENGASFEESFARLQEVVARLSAGSLSLQEALGSFEEGMMLADRCAQMLDEAELRLAQVSDKALRAGSAALVELDEIGRGRASAEPVVVEIETIVQETVIRAVEPETDTRLKPAAPSGTRGAERAERAENGRGQGKGGGQAYAQPMLDELDPLFDDE